jgi:hypothetical protein
MQLMHLLERSDKHKAFLGQLRTYCADIEAFLTSRQEQIDLMLFD